MTRIGYGSDLHLEFGDIDLPNIHNIDLLILVGDIGTPHTWKYNHNNSARSMGDRQKAFFKRINEQYPETIYIPGNHEHYHGDITKTDALIKEQLSEFKHIYTGSHLVYKFADFVVIANTLWTDFENGNNVTFIHANMGMNDFRLITKDGARFQAQDAWTLHQAAKIQIEKDIARFPGKKIIVASHHLPSWQAIAHGFRDDRLNGAYASDLDEFMERNEVSYWIHGHSHPPFNEMIGNTRVMRNPRGYLHHENSVEEDKKYQFKYIDV